ncbi:MAG: GNAT family N-acetyltransferase [Bacteroidales bacterium]|nr:GNAT family N-acetyltransferase [Bacteroidales bacterium]
MSESNSRRFPLKNTRKNLFYPEKEAIGLLQETELVVASGDLHRFSREEWLDFIDNTRQAAFLKALGSTEMRIRWAELIFRIIQQTHYSFRDMFQQRVAKHPDRVLFCDLSHSGKVEWTYSQIFMYLREIGALFYKLTEIPRVALYTENCLEGAAVDLASLSYDIFVTPLSPYFREETLLPIFNRLQINLVVTDTAPRLSQLQSLAKKVALPFRVFTLQPGIGQPPEVWYLPEACKNLTLKEISDLLDRREPLPVNTVNTTMFTSGSTGEPKGVSFSNYNLVCKRFARAAALPEVGEQTFLSYLPLYHTFGRYLEMMGAIFWSGTYIFAGNTSPETLFSLFPKTRPTGFISIPLRWQELYDLCLENTGALEDPLLQAKAVRTVVGDRLQWGLSAAGYLDPRVFRYFNQQGIHLCSGFGMTEATGGITMTEPGNYKDGTVGLSLPGIYPRLTAEGEMELRGHYVARYLDDAGPGDTIPFPLSDTLDKWLSTGDVFKRTKDGHFQIVDRVKDIYKNNRGQTIAPQVIEKKFFRVPGFLSCFLAGDQRPYNVLLIVPDKKDPIFRSLKGEKIIEYYHQVITAANADVAPYERVVNFTVLARDFSAAKGELTPKGSFNRKTIERNFRKKIEQLYTSNFTAIEAPGVTVQIPKWLYRDLGILDSDILLQNGKLINSQNNTRLTFKWIREGRLRIGDLIYAIEERVIDLGIFTRQPALWIGNAELVRFFPVREGWDIPVKKIAGTICIARFNCRTEKCYPELTGVTDLQLIRINRLLFIAIFGALPQALEAITELGELFPALEPGVSDVVRHRMEALGYHPAEEVRTLAYRIILLKAPRPEQIPYMPAFIESGRSFLNNESISEIANSNFGKHRLDALKQRLSYYRNQLTWPADRKNRKQFADVLSLLFRFAMNHLEFYGPVRAELSRWALHRQDPWLSKRAGELFMQLAGIFEQEMARLAKSFPMSFWKSHVTFEHGISEPEKERILKLFQTTTFLEESILLTSNGQQFHPEDVPENGIWVLRMLAFKGFHHYRVSITTGSEHHFDLHAVLSDNPGFKPDPDLFYWLASLAGHPFGPTVAPILGSNKPGHGALSTQYIGGLTAWEKIRTLSEIHQSAGKVHENSWRKLFVRAFTVFFRAWEYSGYQIIPGAISPANVVVPEMDFRETAVILSLTGWSPYKGPLSLVEPMIRDFYQKTAALYPWSRKQLDIRWIFDACIEALGKEETQRFLETMAAELTQHDIRCVDGSGFLQHLKDYLREDFPSLYLPLSLSCAVEQYHEWIRMNPLTTSQAREQTIRELLEIYRLLPYPDVVRFALYRQTYFAGKPVEITSAFDTLIVRLQNNANLMPVQLVELSELQSVITDPEEKQLFSRIVFPRLQPKQRVDFLKRNEEQTSPVMVQFNLKDHTGRPYLFHEPVEPREVGQLYHLFFREHYPREPMENDRMAVVTEPDGQVVGGATWRFLDEKNVLLDGIVVTSALQGRGLGSAIMETFFSYIAAQGIEIVKAHFLFGSYSLKHYFEVDPQWGALIKQLRRTNDQ